jgi:hypothetical protein
VACLFPVLSSWGRTCGRGASADLPSPSGNPPPPPRSPFECVLRLDVCPSVRFVFPTYARVRTHAAACTFPRAKIALRQSFASHFSVGYPEKRHRAVRASISSVRNCGGPAGEVVVTPTQRTSRTIFVVPPRSTDGHSVAERRRGPPSARCTGRMRWLRWNGSKRRAVVES